MSKAGQGRGSNTRQNQMSGTSPYRVSYATVKSLDFALNVIGKAREGFSAEKYFIYSLKDPSGYWVKGDDEEAREWGRTAQRLR